jgi:uncharacterized protein (TIGR04255 family)
VNNRPANLPDFRNPPVDEVAIGVQFAPISNLYDIHAAIFWQKIRSEYPRVETQPRLEGQIESESPAVLQPISVQFPSSGPQQSRTWLINKSDDYLIQIQNIRFVQNWRRRDSPYRHFEALWDLFSGHYRAFKETLHVEGIEQPFVQQVEVTYINWITDLETAQFLRSADAARIVANNRRVEPEQHFFNSRYRLDNGGPAIERLYVQCQPAIRPMGPQGPNAQGIQLALVYKAANVEGLSDDDIETYATDGRATIVNAFAELTTQQAHNVWGKIE